MGWMPPTWSSDIYWRRGSESNRRPRLCRPLHDHSATPPKLKGENGQFSSQELKPTYAVFPGIWSGKGVSNSRPQPWQGCALPTELFPHECRRIIDEAAHSRQGSVSSASRPGATLFSGNRPSISASAVPQYRSAMCRCAGDQRRRCDRGTAAAESRSSATPS